MIKMEMKGPEQKVINLTPHVLNLVDEDGSVKTFPPSGEIARVSMDSTTTPIRVGGVPVVITTFGDITGLPPPEDHTYYIVSGLVRSALPKHRPDVLSPGDLARDETGRVIGARSLQRG